MSVTIAAVSVIAAISAAAPEPPAAPPLKVAAPGLSAVQAPPALAEFANNHLAQALDARGLEVTSGSDLAAVIGLERQKALLGCQDADTSCIAELANALGVDGLLMGEVAKLGAHFQVNVRIVDAQSGKRVAAFSGGAPSEDALVPALEEAADALAEQFSRAHGRTYVPKRRPEPKPSVAKWIVGGVGVALLAAGGAGLVGARGQLAELQQHPATLDEARQIQSRGQTLEALGWTAAGVGVAAVGAAVVMHALGDAGPQVGASVDVVHGGGAVLVGGTW